MFAQSNYEGVAGVDLNYGPVADVQLTATLPLDVTSAARPRVARGEVEVGVKWRFLEDKKRGLSLAMFPRALLAQTALRVRGTRDAESSLPGAPRRRVAR